MYHNYDFDTLNHALPTLFGALLRKGNDIPSRNGDTKELRFTGITLVDSLAREILVPGRKHNLAAQIAETMWVLSGRNDIEWLSRYLPRAVDYSDDGVTWRGAYGGRIRNYGGTYLSVDPVDQLEYVVNLLKTDPGTRQAIIEIYDPNIDTQPGKDIPCNDTLHFLNRDDILDLHIFVRSNDMMWGWSGINVFEWSSLLEVVSGLTGLEAGALHFSVSSFHLYEQHWEKAQAIADEGFNFLAEPGPSPRFDAKAVDHVKGFHNLCHQWFLIEQAIREANRSSHPHDIQRINRLIEDFPEPMMQSWLRVIAWWWTSDAEYLRPLIGTALFASATLAMQPLKRQTPLTLVAPPGDISATDIINAMDPKPLIEEVIALHNEKDAAYGDSWCRRGEMLGIMANIARKVDRLGGATTSDETSLDTAMDLFIYLGKYRAWIDGEWRDTANAVLRTVAEKVSIHDGFATQEYMEGALQEQFADLEKAVLTDNATIREVLITSMLENAWRLVVLLAEAQ